MANISWNPSSLVISELMVATDVKVDISLWTYNDVAGILEETIMLATDLPNSGFTSISLSDSLASALPSSDYDLHTAMLKVAVNSSTTHVSARSNRSLDMAKFRKILSDIGQFGNRTLLSLRNNIASSLESVKARLSCEAWATTTRQVPIRSIPPCPCTVSDAANDDRFEIEDSPEFSRSFFHPDSSSCYRQANVR